ncbi:hypothetical protein V9T40_001035 [Parthenolecanium corni]|uniref:Uncharacterized protein n=1 Tax=Parthenolecanium corni TaxID=536013 RepID=A0AAN9Y0Z8_9HEMI
MKKVLVHSLVRKIAAAGTSELDQRAKSKTCQVPSRKEMYSEPAALSTPSPHQANLHTRLKTKHAVPQNQHLLAQNLLHLYSFPSPISEPRLPPAQNKFVPSHSQAASRHSQRAQNPRPQKCGSAASSVESQIMHADLPNRNNRRHRLPPFNSFH